MKNNPREQNFIDQMVNYCGKKTATQCAIDSGYNSAGARTRASELMARADIRDEIDLRLEEVRKKWLITKDQHFQELGELRDIAKETKNINAAVTAEMLLQI
jgi:phage terminase small subunit